MKALYLSLFCLLLALPVYGRRPDPTATPKGAVKAFQKGSTVEIKVNGMVCSFCVNSIKRKFKKIKQVEKVDVDLDNKIVTVELKKGKTISAKKLRKLIRGSGYKVVEFLPQKTVLAPKVIDAG